MKEEQIYQIALTMIPDIGHVTGKKLIAYCGSAKAVFEEKRKFLEKIPGIGMKTIRRLSPGSFLDKAEKELRFMEKNGVKGLFYSAPDYPSKLKHCVDSPILLYYKGNADLNASRIISIVGTRHCSDYGREETQNLIKELSAYDIMVVSGLAYGIDAIAHQSALKHGLDTVGVLAHGLDRIYPNPHLKIARKMLGQGGLLTDFPSGTNPDRQNFPSRNRIVAGIADATIVMESDIKGGAIITADIANSYSRDVFALPGRIKDQMSAGCNAMIKDHRAGILLGAQHLLEVMGWDDESLQKKKDVQKELFLNLSEDESRVVNFLKANGDTEIDKLSLQCKLSMSKTANVLLELEFKGILKSKPGKRYSLLL